MTDFNEKPTKIHIQGRTFRVRKPALSPAKPRALLLLHGHLGNENVMWVLANPLPSDYYILAPRAPIQLGENQYSWHKITPQWPDIDHYGQLVNELLSHVRTWEQENDLYFSNFDVMGFSQGAVMAYALALLHPEKIGRIAALAGFIPSSWKKRINDPPIKQKQFFVAHGAKDDIVPIKKAHETADWLGANGASVTFCEADIGHKISANCFNGLGEFFS